MISIDDVPQELLGQIRVQFDRDDRVRKLRVEQRVMQQRGDYAAALQVGRSLETLYAQVVQNCIDEANATAEKVDMATLSIPEAEKDELLSCGLVLFMAADMIESAVMDMDSRLHRHDKELHFEMFDDIRELVRLSKEKLAYLKENSDYMADFAWADKCDDMYRMMLSKARSLVRKRKEDKGWGESMKKMYEAQ